MENTDVKSIKERILINPPRYGIVIIPFFLIAGFIASVVLGYTMIVSEIKKSTEAVLRDSAVE